MKQHSFKIIRLVFLFIFGLLYLVSAQATIRPNIILYFVDDMGYGDAGVYGQQMFTTPNLDKTAAEGMLFTDFYAAAAVCAPSRGSLAQGLHTGHGRVKGNNATQWLKDSDVTLFEILQHSGYRTGVFGKWGVGENSPLDNPETHGVDYFYGYVGNWHAHNFYPEWLVKNGVKVPLNNVCTKSCGEDGTTYQGRGVAEFQYEDYAPFFIRDEAMEYIRRNAATPEPFFMMYSPNMPHANNEGGLERGMEVPDYGEFTNMTWPNPEKGFAQMMRYLDNDMGQILHLVESLGIDSSTLVLFTSDNGPHSEGRHNSEFFNSNGDLRGQKRNYWEGGIRVPMIARWPGVIEAGSVTDHIGYSPDFMATFGDLAGVNIPSPSDGISIVPTMLGKKSEQKQHQYLFWRTNRVREGDWKYVGGGLYNLVSDLGESTDVSADHPDVVNRIKGYASEANLQTPLDVTWDSLILEPSLTGGCKDQAYSEFDSGAMFSVPAACLTLILNTKGNLDFGKILIIDNLSNSLKITLTGAFKISFHSIEGSELWHKTGEGNNRFSLDDIYEPGFYYVKLISARGVEVTNWVKF